MRGNQWGQVFSVVTFGESHGPAMGAVIDGCPAGVVWRRELLERFLQRRRPGTSALVSARNEPDQPQLLSGIYLEKTLGTPIAVVIYNQDARSEDYSRPEIQTRRGHATDLWQDKYGHSDPRGSGRASGRETVSRIVAGAVARMFVEQLYPNIKVFAYTERVADISLTVDERMRAEEELRPDPWQVDNYSLRLPNREKNMACERLITAAKSSGESYGGCVQIRLEGLPRSLGEPVFGKLKNCLAASYLSIGATVAFEIGDGFTNSIKCGTEFHHDEQDYSGLRGGLSTGDPLWARVAFKPTSSLGTIAKAGRHDPCIVPRAVPVVEAMSWMVLADLILLNRLDRI